MDADRSAGRLPEREAEALAEIAATRVRPALAVCAVTLFALALVAGPALEPLLPLPRAGLDRPEFDRVAPERAELRRAWRRAGWGGLAVELAATIARAESRIDRFGALARLLRPPTQRLLAARLGQGNDEVVVGRDGWLFLRPAIEHTAAPGFLAASKGADDPARGLIAFQRELDAHGVRLVVLPVPEKEQIHPERLVGTGLVPPLRNRDFGALAERLRAEGVALFDPAPALVELAREGEVTYLATDTHWTPRAVDRVAARLAEFLRREVGLPPVGPAGLSRRPVRFTFQGDLDRLLALAPGSSPFRPESEAAARVFERDGRRFDAAAASSPILVLGDSFSLVFSRQGGRLQSAGLADQLAFHLDAPVRLIGDVRANSLARRIRWLGRDLSGLRETRVLVYQFAARDLSIQDWTTSRAELPRYGGRPLTSRRLRR